MSLDWSVDMVALAFTGLMVKGFRPSVSTTICLPASRDALLRVPVDSAAETAISVKGVMCTSELVVRSCRVDLMTVPTGGMVLEAVKLPSEPKAAVSSNIVVVLVMVSLMTTGLLVLVTLLSV